MTKYVSGERMTDIYDTPMIYMRESARIEEWQISEGDKELFIDFLRSMRARGTSYVQLLKYIQSMRTFIKFYDKGFAELARTDLEGFLIYMERFKPKTRKIKWYAVKKFFGHIGLGGVFFRVKFQINRERLPEQILTRGDIELMVENMRCHRDACFCAMLYESGCRVGELLMVRCKDVNFDDNGAIIMVSGKTGNRRIRIVKYAPLLKRHILRSCKSNDDRIFNLSYPNAAKILRESAWRVEIRKPVNPHAFRHARATHLANKLTESQLKEFFGWRQGSEMAQIYVHLSGRDIDEAIIGLYKDEEDFQQRKKMGIG